MKDFRPYKSYSNNLVCHSCITKTQWNNHNPFHENVSFSSSDNIYHLLIHIIILNNETELTVHSLIGGIDCVISNESILWLFDDLLTIQLNKIGFSECLISYSRFKTVL